MSRCKVREYTELRKAVNRKEKTIEVLGPLALKVSDTIKNRTRNFFLGIALAIVSIPFITEYMLIAKIFLILGTNIFCRSFFYGSYLITSEEKRKITLVYDNEKWYKQ